MITAPSLSNSHRVRHGFFTREGGVSGGVFASLNCGYGSGDDPANVAANRDRAMARVDLGGDALVTLHQVHSADVVAVDKPWPAGQAPKADALVTKTPGVALGILTADCAPVLMADAEAGVIGAAHAGWRGALAGIIAALVAAMEALGAERGRLRAAIGPTIRQPSYEVGPELRAAFTATDPENAAYFEPAPRNGHFLFDLPGFLKGEGAGLGVADWDIVDADTCAEEARFFSYRRAVKRNEDDYGRGLSAIVLGE